MDAVSAMEASSDGGAAAGGGVLPNLTAGNSTSAEHIHVERPPPQSIFAFYLVMFCMIGSQSAIFMWKKKHQRSYELVTLVGLWLVPAFMALRMSCWRFLTVWAVYSLITGYWLRKCSAGGRMASTTPRKVYAWFLSVYRVSVVLGLSGYALCILQVFDPILMLGGLLPPTLPFLLLWYGIYFGVLGRDSAEVASDRMAAVMGTGRRLTISVKSCGMCTGDLPDFGAPPRADGQTSAVPAGEQTVTLQCRHSFHRECLQGWTIVGKKDTCPQCLEKVDLRALYAEKPWMSRNLNYIQMLDSLRYLIVWLPAILTAAHVLLHLLGLDPPHEQVAKAAGVSQKAAEGGAAAAAAVEVAPP